VGLQGWGGSVAWRFRSYRVTDFQPLLLLDTPEQRRQVTQRSRSREQTGFWPASETLENRFPWN